LSNPYALHLPNLRANFLPDPDYALVEADLARADAQTIAWEAGAEELKRALRADEDIHSECALVLYGADKNPRAMHTNGMSYRDNSKRWQHGTNFAGKHRTLASVLVLPEAHVERCQLWWLREKHPALGQLHERIQFELNSRKAPVIYNRFGFRRAYVGGSRQDGNLLQQALAWIAQSTTACVINRALLQIDCGHDIFGEPRCGRCLTCEVPEAQVLLQVHDSILLQVPLHLLTPEFIARFQAAMRVVVPYDDPLVIGTEIKWSARHWGEMHKWTGSTETAIAA
jgi:DNA polymerase I-like protein with 3'-5' exonuclease and polymerase domains